MNNPNPFLPQGSFLEQKNKARKRLNIVVYFSISVSVMALMALLIQGCRKPNDNTADNGSTDTSAIPLLPTNPPVDTNVAATPPPETNPAPLPPPTLPPAVPPPVVSAGEDYTVVKGDTLAGIAKNSHVSLRALQDANPGVDAKRLKIGQKLHLPAATSTSTSVSSTMPGMAETSAGGEQTYKVKSGDTLTVIAKHYHVTIKSIQSANGLSSTSIKVGQVLKIPGAVSPGPAPVPAPVESAPPPAVSMPTSSVPPPAH
jgi:LysM repeat protein